MTQRISTTSKKRNNITFEPSGPISSMIVNEMRSHTNRTMVLEDCIAKALGAKYPKLLEKFKILREEKTA